MNSLENVPIIDPEEDDMINIGDGRKVHMTKGLYFNLMSSGQHDIIPQKWHERFYNDYLKWYQNAHNKYMNEMNPVLNRNNVPGEFNARKTSGRQARNKKAGFSGKKNKTARKALNVFKNKRSKRRAQIIAPLNQLKNTIEESEVNVAPHGNETDKEFEIKKRWAVNYLVGAIYNARSIADLEADLEKPLNAGWEFQPPEIQYTNYKSTNYDGYMQFNGSPIKRQISDPHPLKYYFDPGLKLTLNMPLYNLPKYTRQNAPISNIYDREPVNIPLIDVVSDSIYVIVRDYYHKYSNYNNTGSAHRYIYLTPFLAAMLNKSPDNLAILQKVLGMGVSIDELDLKYLFYMNLNASIFDQVDLTLLNEVSLRLEDLSDDVISYIISLLNASTARWVSILLNNTKVVQNRKVIDAIYNKLFEILRKGFYDYQVIDEIFNAIELLKSLNITQPANLYEDELIYYLTSSKIAGYTQQSGMSEINRILKFLISKININKQLDSEGNNILMLILKAPLNIDLATIEMIIGRPEFNPNSRNSTGETALAIAIKSGKNIIAKRLMRIPGQHLNAKNIYGQRIMNHLKRGITSNANAPANAPVNAPLPNFIEWNNNIATHATGRTTRRNNYRNMMRTYEKAIKPRIAMTMGAKKVYIPNARTGYRKAVNIGPNLGRHIASFVPSAAPNQ